MTRLDCLQRQLSCTRPRVKKSLKRALRQENSLGSAMHGIAVVMQIAVIECGHGGIPKSITFAPISTTIRGDSAKTGFELLCPPECNFNVPKLMASGRLDESTPLLSIPRIMFPLGPARQHHLSREAHRGFMHHSLPFAQWPLPGKLPGRQRNSPNAALIERSMITHEAGCSLERIALDFIKSACKVRGNDACIELAPPQRVMRCWIGRAQR